MTEESLENFNIAIDNYYRLTRGIPVEPVLFRIITLLRVAFSEEPVINSQLDTRSKIMCSIL